MVCLDLHTQGEGKESRSQNSLRQPGFPTLFSVTIFLVIPSVAKGSHRRPICEYDSRQHPREIGYSLHLGVVADLDDLHIVGTECYRDGSGDGDKLACADGQHKQEASDEGYQKVARRAASCQQEVIDRVGPVTLEAVDCGCRRHSSEHRVCPRGRVLRMSLVMGHRFICHTFPRGYVALVHDLAVEYLRREAVGQADEKQEDACVYSDVLQYCSVHIFICIYQIIPPYGE